jgi:hypothetical protein
LKKNPLGGPPGKRILTPGGAAPCLHYRARLGILGRQTTHRACLHMEGNDEMTNKVKTAATPAARAKREAALLNVKPYKATLATVNAKLALVTKAVTNSTAAERETVKAVDFAMTAAKACPQTAKAATETVRNTYKAAYIAERLRLEGSNQPEAKRLEMAETILKSANAEGTGDLKKGQRRRKPEEEKMYKASGTAWSRILAQTGHAPVKAASNGNKGKKRKPKAGQGAAAPTEKVVPLKDVAKYVPPARKDLTVTALAAWCQSAANNGLALSETLQQKAAKTGEPGPSLDLVNALMAFRDAINAAAKKLS